MHTNIRALPRAVLDVGGVLVGEVSMFDVPHVVVLAACTTLDDPPHDRVAIVVVILEQCADTHIFGVSVNDFVVGCSPGLSWSLAPPRDASPKIYALFYTALLTFVPRHLQQE